MIVSVVGLGKLGATLCGVLASKGHTVIGLDVDPETIDKVNRGIAPVAETNLQQLYDDYGSHIIYAGLIDKDAADIADCEIIFFVVPTPSMSNGHFTSEIVRSAARDIGQAMKKDNKYRLLVLVSTVMPGETEKTFIKTLEESSDKVCGEDFGVCYNPEFIALGSIVADMIHPDFVLIGEADPEAGNLLEQFYWTICPDTPVFRMPLADAEIAKLALNCYVTMKISYANMIGSLCSSVPGTDVYKILEAVGADSRVGSICLKPATAYGGPCFPRDTRAMIAFADEIGTSAPLVLATQQVNDVQSFHLLRIVRNIRSGSQVVGVLGLAYKTTTAVIEKSAGMDLVGLLRANNIPVETFDRLATEQSTTKSAQECVDKSDVIVIMLPEPDFWPSKIEYGQKPIIDCWDIIGKRS